MITRSDSIVISSPPTDGADLNGPLGSDPKHEYLWESRSLRAAARKTCVLTAAHSITKESRINTIQEGYLLLPLTIDPPSAATTIRPRTTTITIFGTSRRSRSRD